jgi:LuxR family quorum-sensing system transcriptional regulator SolR
MPLSTDLYSIKQHLALTGSSVVADLMLPKLKQHGIKVFNFNRQYDDGSFLRLSSDAVWNEHYFEKGYVNKRKKVPDSYLTKPINYFLWMIKDWPEMLTDAAVNFDTSNGISIAEKCDGYMDFYCFGAKTNNTSIANFYLNNLDLLQAYGRDFKEMAANLLTSYEKDRIILPDTEIISEASPRLDLSTRQLQCAHLLLQGKSGKEMALTLNLSARTVESYLENMKIKLACRNKADLIIKLSVMIA